MLSTEAEIHATTSCAQLTYTMDLKPKNEIAYYTTVSQQRLIDKSKNWGTRGRTQHNSSHRNKKQKALHYFSELQSSKS